MAKNEKSKAELYREERKERIAAAAKKNAKRSRKHPNAGKIAGKVIGIVLIMAVVGLACYGILNTTGFFARTKTALTIGESKVSVAEYGYMYYMQYQNTVNQAQQSEQQYGYNMYGFDYTKAPADQDSTGTDDDGNTISWAEQLKKNTVTYLQEFYTMYALAEKEGYKVNEKEKADIDDQIEQMRKTAAGDGTTTQNSISMSLNSYLKVQYGKGITEHFLRNLMEKEMIVQRYSEDKQKSFEDKYTDEELDKEYKKDTTEYDAVDMRVYAFTPETLDAKDGESEEALAKRQEAENAKQMEKAEALLAKVTDEESFKEAAEVYIEEQEAKDAAETAGATEDADAADAEDEAKAEPADDKAEDAAAAEETTEETAEAAADEEKTEETADAAADEEKTEETAEAADAEADEEEHDHDGQTKAYGMKKSNLTSTISEDAGKWAFAAKAGAKKAFAAENGTAYALYVVKAAYAQEGVDVRHILFMTVDSESGEELSAEEKAEKKAKSEEVLAEWNAGEKTEDAFAELANSNSEDTGSNTNGGLYEHVTPGQMVDSFDKWIFDESRKEGDVEIIESEYGYHIMYYVGNRDFVYRDTLRTSHTQDDYSSWLEGELDTVVENDAGMQAGYNRADRLIQATVQYLQNQAASSASADATIG